MKQENKLIETVCWGTDKDIERMLTPSFWHDVPDVNCQDEKGRTPLMFACERGQKSVVQMLLDKGASIDIVANDGQTALMRVLKKVFICDEMIELLVERGASLHLTDKNGKTPLAIAQHQTYIDLYHKNFNGYKNGKDYIIHYLIEHGANPDIKDEKGDSLLVKAIKETDEDFIRFLIDHKVNLEIGDKEYGASPLTWAALKNMTSVAKYLIEQGADINAVDSIGHSPLTMAVEKGNFELFELLVEKGADIFIKDSNGKSLIIYAVQSGQKEMLEYLIKNGVDVNESDNKGTTPIMCAAVTQNTEFLTCLVQNKSQIDVQDCEGNTALMLAAAHGNMKTVKLLYEYGAQIDIVNQKRMTALLLAAENRQVDVIRYFLETGLITYQPNYNGEQQSELIKSKLQSQPVENLIRLSQIDPELWKKTIMTGNLPTFFRLIPPTHHRKIYEKVQPIISAKECLVLQQLIRAGRERSDN